MAEEGVGSERDWASDSRRREGDHCITAVSDGTELPGLPPACHHQLSQAGPFRARTAYKPLAWSRYRESGWRWGLVFRAKGERWNNNTSSWNVVHWEPSRVDELERIQVGRESSQSQTDESDPGRRQLIFTVLPG